MLQTNRNQERREYRRLQAVKLYANKRNHLASKLVCHEKVDHQNLHIWCFNQANQKTEFCVITLKSFYNVQQNKQASIPCKMESRLCFL
jgi:hypothetical protein